MKTLIIENRIHGATIVDRRSGPGYRVVLRQVTPSGTPIIDTLEDNFATIEAAREFALVELGVTMDRLKLATERRMAIDVTADEGRQLETHVHAGGLRRGRGEPATR
jgi:hypothetical protein